MICLFFPVITIAAQVQETNEARQKFSNAKSISSAQFFGDQNKANELDTQASLQKFSVRTNTASSNISLH